MGARRHVVVCAIVVGAALAPDAALAKGEKKAESPADGEARVMSVMQRRAEPGWAGRQQALHWMALGARGKARVSGALKSAFQHIGRSRGRIGPLVDEAPLRRADAAVSTVLSRLKAAGNGRKLIAPKALGEQVADHVYREERRDPTDRK